MERLQKTATLDPEDILPSVSALCTVIGISGSTYDGLLADLLAGAGRAIEQTYAPGLVLTQGTFQLDSLGKLEATVPCTIPLPRWPVSAVSAVEALSDWNDIDTGVTATHELIPSVSPGVPALLQVTADANTAGFRATFTAGYADEDLVPADLQWAILQIAATRFFQSTDVSRPGHNPVSLPSPANAVRAVQSYRLR